MFSRDKCWLIMQVLHCFQGRTQFRATEQIASSWDHTSIDITSTRQDGGFLRRISLIQSHCQLHEVTVRQDIILAQFCTRVGIACIDDSTSVVDQVDLQSIFVHVRCSNHDLTVDMLEQFSIGIEVQRVTGVLNEETELLERTFQFNTSSTNTVNTTTVFTQYREFVRDSTNITAGTIQVTISDFSTSCINTLIVNITIIEQWQVMEHLQLFAEVRRNGFGRSQLSKVLLFLSIFHRLTLVIRSINLRANARRFTLGRSLILHNHRSVTS